MRIFIKAEAVIRISPEDLKTFGIENQLSEEDLVVGEARQELSNMKSEAAQLKEIMGIRFFCSKVSEYLVTKLPSRTCSSIQ